MIHTPTDQQTVETTFAEPPMSYQTIKDVSGAIQYVVVPYADFLRLSSRVETAVPNEVAERVIMGKLTPIRAWREYLGLRKAT